MPERLQILIAAAENLARFKQRLAVNSEVLAYSDTDALIALDVITQRQPSAVVIERDFATTSRGAALINRLRADPALAGVLIQLISPEGLHAPAAPTPAPAVAGATATTAPVAHLDKEGTRFARRYPIRQGVEVIIDGNPVTLVDLSIEGAQVISPSLLRPKQRVRIVLSDKGTSLRYTGTIAWASFELPSPNVQRYRAGVAFVNPEPDAILTFAERNKAD
ncbi:MAG: PilZ domain-containing protein [Acidobacteria bacterium]|nr:PilZ domain-containing protein [Acidobacteriota bacterium]